MHVPLAELFARRSVWRTAATPNRENNTSLLHLPPARAAIEAAQPALGTADKFKIVFKGRILKDESTLSGDGAWRDQGPRHVTLFFHVE
jgi:hypothetical protein